MTMKNAFLLHTLHHTVDGKIVESAPGKVVKLDKADFDELEGTAVRQATREEIALAGHEDDEDETASRGPSPESVQAAAAAAEKAETERLAAEKAATEKAETERLAAEKAAAAPPAQTERHAGRSPDPLG